MSLEKIYRGPADPATPKELGQWLEAPPPWRDHRDQPAVEREVPSDPSAERRGKTYVSSGDDEVDRVNLALWLRRPLLVTGPPGIGKSSLAYGIAESLGLGAPLRWEINSQSTLREGLYNYDAVAHFQATRSAGKEDVAASEFIRLGPLGTSFVPTALPRVLLVDELDKAPWDLPNDLLHILEEAAFTIPEVARQEVPGTVQLDDSVTSTDRVALDGARVRVRHHPVVVITSNAEREFSNAFRRRCVALRMSELDPGRLAAVVRSQLGDVADLDSRLSEMGEMETDIVLQALYAMSHGADLGDVRDILRRT